MTIKNNLWVTLDIERTTCYDLKGSNGLSDPSQVLIYLPPHLSLETMPPSCKSSTDSTAKTSEVPTTSLCCSVSFLLSSIIVSQFIFSSFFFFFQIAQLFQSKKRLVSIQNWALTLSNMWFWLCWVSTIRHVFSNSFYVSFYYYAALGFPECCSQP